MAYHYMTNGTGYVVFATLKAAIRSAETAARDEGISVDVVSEKTGKIVATVRNDLPSAMDRAMHPWVYGFDD